jgi:hypothetical protein
MTATKIATEDESVSLFTPFMPTNGRMIPDTPWDFPRLTEMPANYAGTRW